MNINAMCMQYLRRYRMPTTAGGWFFFVLAVLCLAVGRYNSFAEKITSNTAAQKAIRVGAYIACVIFMIFAVVAG